MSQSRFPNEPKKRQDNTSLKIKQKLTIETVEQETKFVAPTDIATREQKILTPDPLDNLVETMSTLNAQIESYNTSKNKVHLQNLQFLTKLAANLVVKSYRAKVLELDKLTKPMIDSQTLDPTKLPDITHLFMEIKQIVEIGTDLVPQAIILTYQDLKQALYLTRQDLALDTILDTIEKEPQLRQLHIQLSLAILKNVENLKKLIAWVKAVREPFYAPKTLAVPFQQGPLSTTPTTVTPASTELTTPTTASPPSIASPLSARSLTSPPPARTYASYSPTVFTPRMPMIPEGDEVLENNNGSMTQEQPIRSYFS